MPAVIRERGADRRTLYQFPASHYCEKARWMLDAKGLSYETRDLLPGVHLLVNRWIGARRTVPVLVEGSRVVGDTTEIALFLEEKYPERPLLPRDPDLRAEVLSLEDSFDSLGSAVRRWAYGQTLKTPGLSARLFFEAYGPAARTVGRLGARAFESMLRKRYRIDDERVARSERQIREGVARLEAIFGDDPSRYLVGSSLSLADITAASLLGLLVGPPHSPWREASALLSSTELRRWFEDRPSARWIEERYARDRLAEGP